MCSVMTRFKWFLQEVSPEEIIQHYEIDYFVIVSFNVYLFACTIAFDKLFANAKTL